MTKHLVVVLAAVLAACSSSSSSSTSGSSGSNGSSGGSSGSSGGTGGTWTVQKVNDPSNPGAAQEPSLAVSGQGDIFVAWRETDVIYAARFDHAAGTWGAATRVSDVALTDLSDPLVVADGSGNATLVYTGHDAGDGTSPLLAVRYSGGAWAATGTGLASGFSTAGLVDTSIMANANGDVVIVYPDFGNGLRQRPAVNFYSAASSSWGTAFFADSDTETTACSNFSAAINASGQAVVAWKQDVGNGPQVRAALVTGAGASTAHTLDGSTNQNVGSPLVGIGGDGSAVVLWETDDGSTYTVQSVRTSGGTFGSPQTVQAAQQQTGAIAVAVDGAGNATATFNSGIAIYTSQQTAAGGAWSTALLHTQSATAGGKLAVDTAGDAVTAWSDVVGGSVNASTYAGGTWTDQTVTSAPVVVQVEVAISGAGKGALAWIELEGSGPNSDVFVARQP